jgi:ubiquinone/menaquinone biosynthesis C-methylase UbiE
MGTNASRWDGGLPAETVGADASGTKAYRGLAMEGAVARWYARTRGTQSQLELWAVQAEEVTTGLSDGAELLEVAPGPGYFAIALARLGRFRVTALDISRTFVEIATENARRAGVRVAVHRGDASRMPYPDRAFDLVVCQAAFKNFSRPQAAVDEMYRVLRAGGVARIEDMRRDASDEAVRQEVDGMGLTRGRAFLTNRTLRSLRRRAYTAAEFERFAASSPFLRCEIELEPIGLNVRLERPRSAP